MGLEDEADAAGVFVPQPSLSLNLQSVNGRLVIPEEGSVTSNGANGGPFKPVISSESLSNRYQQPTKPLRMGLQPIAHNAQVQRLTTALKNICRDYPAGGIVLRELLQNADDAGATVVRFVLDERTHPIDQLINPKLEPYQGPALLAYNNAIFTDTDFSSLSRLGDSLKLNDGSTTGKFGRGFNSVYNWTDSPSIVSRERLLILDPHLEWSGGGPVYDFVANSGEVAIQNHMAAFQTVMEHLDRYLAGTVIRIPLRTEAQAANSEISDRGTTVSDVLDVFQSFASEFGNNGLLFMRNIEKLEIGSATGISIEIEMIDSELLRSHKSKVNNAVKRSLKNLEYSFDYSFEAGIEYRAAGESTKTKFVVHHSILPGLMDSELRDWAQDQKLVPWVAVAAQLPIQCPEKIKGSLFTVLPLPIPTSQPVHIHGLFSISPDRARLYQFNDRSTQDQTPATWNNWLLQTPVPVAWARLLSYIAVLHPLQPAFGLWPESIDDDRDPLSNATANLIGIIDKEGLALWSTEVGYVTANKGLLDTGEEPEALRDALRETKAPVVYIPQQLRQGAKKLFRDRVLCPRSLCSFLKLESSRIRLCSDQSKHRILEYLLSEPGFSDYVNLELFPFQDGNYRSIGDYTAFVHRDEFESDLFCLEDFRNLDLAKLSAAAQRALRDGCENSTIHPSIRYRSANSLRDYCMSNIFKNVPEDRDMVVLGDEPTAFVSKVWTWISTHRIDILDKAISCLWLLPLSNGQYRKVKPRSSSSQVYIAPAGEVGKLMWKFDAKSSPRPLPLLDTGSIVSAPELVSILMTKLDAKSNLFIYDASSIVLFLHWLHQTSPLVDDGANEDKMLIARLVASHLPQRLTSSQREIMVEALRFLQIFQKISWQTKGDRMERILTWTNLNSCSKSIGVFDISSPVPEISGVQFLVAQLSSHPQKILEKLELANCLWPVQIIQDHIIPAWRRRQDSHWTSSCKEQMAALILRQFSSLSLDVQTQLPALPMVPVTQLNTEKVLRFKLAAELFDPSIPELKGLCFDDEEIYPKNSFFRIFSVALKGCGLKSAVDEAVVTNRVRCYSNTKYLLSDIQERAERLLRSTCRWNSTLKELEASDLRRLKWLPTVDLSGHVSLKASNECRGFGDKPLVSSQLPILTIPISAEWEERLGWKEKLSDRILLLQLNFGIQKKNRPIVDSVLDYISQPDLAEPLANRLMNLPCVLTSSGLFVLPSQAFRPPGRSIRGCEHLQPYLANVDRRFWQHHKDLLTRLKVGDRPQLSDLLKVQTKLESKPTVEESDVAVAIEILNFACEFPRDSLAAIKVISESRQLHPIQDINVNDLGVLKTKHEVNLTHPEIPPRTIQRLGIGSLREKLMKGMLEIEDEDDEDEFDQRENVTTRIADTLDRYPVESTFREYLANADDAKDASRISWLLDERTHPHDSLLTPEMEPLQGPAFLVHNDGVFSEDDFKGFKNVGEGSKAHDRDAIGQFGRGSQTMYHWTDVPMILSGRYLLILDPCREVLPRSQATGKHKPGVKLELPKIRDACPDQLVPFEGLWDYTQGLDSYSGTIFRFPLRNSRSKSILRASKTNLNSHEILSLMDVYLNEARISLLFLRRIRSISFSTHSFPNSGWSVTRRPPLDEDSRSFSEHVICECVKNSRYGTQISAKDKWWVTIEDLDSVPSHLPDSPRRLMKNVECGLAALISSTFDGFDRKEMPPSFIQPIQPRIFKTLPLPILSDLPVHVHATFLLSGDRQSIAVDEYGPQSHESKWNRYLLQDALPNLYLQFLDSIGTQVGQDVFKFWPQGEPPQRSCAELLCASFWKKLPNSSRRLFPKAQLTLGRRRRRAAELFDISQAVFDFLPKHESDILASLLISLEVNLVRHIPPEVAKRLKEIQPEVRFVTGPLLRELFRTDSSKTCLLEKLAEQPRILEVLFRHLIPADSDLEELDGCHLLPVADGSLATLKFVDPNDTKLSKYYVASNKELKLFEFAARYLVTWSTGVTFVAILQSGKFNLTRLRLCHIRKLLEMRPVVSIPNPEAERWLTEFWEFWNGKIDPSPLSSNIDDFDVKIFRATCDSVGTYATPVEFRQFAAVVEPSIVEHQQLCDKIPGLYRFNPKFMPKSLMNNEKSFNSDISFYKFVRALRVLAGHSGVGIFVHTHLDHANKKILRGLVVSHLSKQAVDPKSARLSADLKSIPLWPSFFPLSTDHLIPASNALMAVNNRLLMPWMKHRHRFVDPQFSRFARINDCLLQLGVKVLSTEVLLNDYVLPLPSTLSDTYWQSFKPLIATISDTISSADFSHTLLPALSQRELAADGNRKLRKACELYDHLDQIFVSAFRHQRETTFLHDDLKEYREFWVRVGLRHRVDTFIKPEDFIQCLQAIKLRLSAEDRHMDPHLQQDSQTVLYPLIAPNSKIQRPRAHDWSVISQESVFLSRTDFNAESEYRRQIMASVAAKQPLLRLSEVISLDHVGICWSQTSFPIHQPSREVLGKVPGNGQPKIVMVWLHLEQMKEVSQHLKLYQVHEFLADLNLTYEYLQDHLHESAAGFNLGNSAIWLNTDASSHNAVLLDDVKSSWHGIEELVLSSSIDAGPIKAVRRGLMRYEKLLRALRCSSVVHPVVTRPEIVSSWTLTNSLQQLRRKGELIDIKYSTEGKTICAHRVVLAAMSEKCAHQFSGRWKVEDVIYYDKNVDPEDFLSYHTLSTMVNYAYENQVNWEEMEVSENDGVDAKAVKLDLLLDLHKGADCWLIPALASEVEDKILFAGRKLINLENVERIRERAEQVRAMGVERMCAEFMKENRNILEKVIQE